MLNQGMRTELKKKAEVQERLAAVGVEIGGELHLPTYSSPLDGGSAGTVECERASMAAAIAQTVGIGPWAAATTTSTIGGYTAAAVAGGLRSLRCPGSTGRAPTPMRGVQAEVPQQMLRSAVGRQVHTLLAGGDLEERR